MGLKKIQEFAFELFIIVFFCYMLIFCLTQSVLGYVYIDYVSPSISIVVFISKLRCSAEVLPKQLSSKVERTSAMDVVGVDVKNRP